MRKTKRMLAMLLTVVMLASCMTTAVVAANGKFSDVKTDAIYATAVETLSKMGVINGYEDGSFRPDQNVTRAEFTAMLMRTLNYGSLGATSAAALPFTDLNDADTSINWSYPNINTAYNMGIINGYEDSTFRPKNNVSYEEALKMIVCTLGYTGIDVATTPWYSNYVAQANRLGITDVAASLGQVETPATRACIAQMLYDSLEANICENDKVTDKTILTSYLGFVKNTGVISSDGVTGLTAPDVNLEDNEVEIYAPEADGTYQVHKYETADETLKNYLGCQVDFYYKNTGSRRVLQFCVLTENKELTLTPELIEDSESSNTQIRYYKSADSDATTSVNLDSDNVVIYNGKLYGTTDKESRFTTEMLPKIGSVTLIDSDNDKKYDVVKIQSYEVYYVSSKVTADETIVDDVTRTGDARKAILDSDYTTIKDTEGRAIKFSSIPTGSIVCLAKTNAANGGEVIQNAVVVTESVTGTVTGTKGKTTVSINNVAYEYSPAAPWMDGNSGTQEAPQIQDEGKYFMDINGKIVAYKKDATTAGIAYGYLMGIAKGDSTFSDSKSARVLTAGGSEAFYTINTSTKVDGKSYETTDEIVAALEAGAKSSNTDSSHKNLTVQQVMKYSTTTSDGKPVLKDIYLAAPTNTGQTMEPETLYYYNKVKAAKSLEYKSSAKQLSGDGINVNVGNAAVFVVPSNRTDYDEYAVKSSATSVFRNGEDYNVELFDVSTTNVAKIIVCYGADASRKVDSYTGVSVVTEATGTATNSTEGKNMTYMTGYLASSDAKGAFNELWISDETEYTPELGDIFRAGADKSGYAKIAASDVLYKVAGGNTYGQFYSSSDFYSSTYAVVLGSVYAIEDGVVSIIPDYLTKGDTVTDADIAKSMPFNISTFKNARVVTYNYKNDNVTLDTITDVSSDYEGILKGMTPYNEGLSSPTKVLIYLYEGNVKMICVLGDEIAK